MLILGVPQANDRDRFWMSNFSPLTSARVGSVDMGSFVVSPAALAAQNPILHTGSAGPCVIVAMTSRNHAGAIAHVAGTEQVDVLVQAVRDMRTGFMPATPSEVVLAAGSEFTPAQRAEIVKTLADEFGVTVQWVHPDEQNDVSAYSMGILFPARSRLLLYTDDDEDSVSDLTGWRCPAMRYNGF